MEGRCTQKKITLEYPKHYLTPEDLLVFIESHEFTASWSDMGMDDEDDLESLQLCIMANPLGDGEIDGAGGLRTHSHSFDWDSSKPTITAYYGYFADFGIVYFTCVEEAGEPVEFSMTEKVAIRESLIKVKRELDRKQTIR